MLNIENELRHSLDALPDGKVKEAALYALMGNGKRIRPSLLFSVLDAYHFNNEKGINSAIAIEMIHTYSLIHDDLPAMDNDDLRRGRPTVHKAYSEDIAILAGDALLSEAFHFANHSSESAHINSHIVDEVVRAAGLSGMIYGQELDVLNDGSKPINREALDLIEINKSGKLIALPMVIGARLAEKNGDVQTWREIGENIGLLFQIQDDILDSTATSDTLGKSVNSDLRNGKQTYCSLLGVNKCQQIINELYEKAISDLKTMIIDEDPMIEIFNMIMNRRK